MIPGTRDFSERVDELAVEFREVLPLEKGEDWNSFAILFCGISITFESNINEIINTLKRRLHVIDGHRKKEIFVKIGLTKERRVIIETDNITLCTWNNVNLFYVKKDKKKRTLSAGSWSNSTEKTSINSNDRIPRNIVEIFCRIIEKEALIQAQKSIKDSLIFHASCITKDSEAILFIGKSNSGKSTFAKLISKLGWDYYADDIVSISPNEKTIESLPKSPHPSKNTAYTPPKKKHFKGMTIVLLKRNDNWRSIEEPDHVESFLSLSSALFLEYNLNQNVSDSLSKVIETSKVISLVNINQHPEKSVEHLQERLCFLKSH